MGGASLSACAGRPPCRWDTTIHTSCALQRLLTFWLCRLITGTKLPQHDLVSAKANCGMSGFKSISISRVVTLFATFTGLLPAWQLLYWPMRYLAVSYIQQLCWCAISPSLCLQATFVMNCQH